MTRFEDILDKVESYKPDFDEELLQKAYIFSAREHRGQVRSSGDPYLIHPLNVAYILAEMRLDETSIAVGLLHDVLEDTLTTKETLQQTFGDDIADLHGLGPGDDRRVTPSPRAPACRSKSTLTRRASLSRRPRGGRHPARR
jgi:hypothetical protein